MSNKTKCPISGIEEDIPRNVHYAVLDEKNSHIKRLEAAIRALLTNIDIEGLLLHIRKGTTSEELLETERDALRASVTRLEDALRPFALEAYDYDPDEGDGNQIAFYTSIKIGQLRAARRALEEK